MIIETPGPGFRISVARGEGARAAAAAVRAHGVAACGVMATPGFAVGERVVPTGKGLAADGIGRLR